MIHRGLSGFAVEIDKERKIVRKWTRGLESTPKLTASFHLQLEEYFSGKLYPMKTVPVTMCDGSKKDFIEFQMPFIDGNSGFTEWKHCNEMCDQIKKSFKSRKNDLRSGFHSICLTELSKFKFPHLKLQIVDLLSQCSDKYPYGFCHGDLGFANMIVDAEGQIHLIGFTPSFIDSPLMDLVAMENSLASEHAKPFHFWLCESIGADFSRFSKHKEVLRMIKALSFFNEGQSQEREKELMDLFYARYLRSSDI